MKKISFIVTVVVILLSVVVFNSCDIGLDMTHGTAKKVLNSDAAIYNYEWFKQQNEDINGLKKKLEISKKSLDDYMKNIYDKTNSADKEEYSRLKVIIDGIQYQLTDAVAKYNARSKMASRKIFKDKLIPFILED